MLTVLIFVLKDHVRSGTLLRINLKTYTVSEPSIYVHD